MRSNTEIIEDLEIYYRFFRRMVFSRTANPFRLLYVLIRLRELQLELEAKIGIIRAGVIIALIYLLEFTK